MKLEEYEKHIEDTIVDALANVVAHGLANDDAKIRDVSKLTIWAIGVMEVLDKMKRRLFFNKTEVTAEEINAEIDSWVESYVDTCDGTEDEFFGEMRFVLQAIFEKGKVAV